MSKYKTLSTNIGLYTISTLSSRIISFLLVPYYTYLLSTAEYGSIDLLTTSLSMIIPIISLCISDAVLRFVNKKEKDCRYVLSNGLLICCFDCLLVLFIYPFLSIAFLNDIKKDFFILLTIQIFFSVINQYTRGSGHLKVFGISNIILTGSMAGLNILFLSVFHWGINGYLRAFSVSYLIGIVYQFLITKAWKEIKLAYISKSILFSMLRYSIPLIPTSIIWWITDATDKYMIAFFLGISSNGLYAVAKKIPTIISSVQSIFIQAWQLSAIDESNSSDKDSFFSRIFDLLSVLMLITVSMVLFVAKPFLWFFVEESYFEAWKYIPFLLLAVMFSCFNGFLGANYLAMKDSKGALFTTVYGGLFNVLFNYIMIPRWGMNGASFATFLSYLLIFLIRINHSKKFVKITYNCYFLLISYCLIALQILILYCIASIQLVSIIEGLLFSSLTLYCIFTHKAIMKEIWVFVLKKISRR